MRCRECAILHTILTRFGERVLLAAMQVREFVLIPSLA